VGEQCPDLLSKMIINSVAKAKVYMQASIEMKPAHVGAATAELLIASRTGCFGSG